MSNLDRLVERTLLAPDAAARAVRARGRRVVGFLGPDIPVELILAAGALAWQLPWRAPGETPLADRYLEPSFHPQERSAAEQWLRGEFDWMDAVVFSRGSDSTQRLYYYLCELQRRGLAAGPRPMLFDVCKIPRSSSADYTRGALERLAGQLGALPHALSDAIALSNRRRELMGQLQRRRAAASAPDGSAVARLVRAAGHCVPDEFDAALARWLTQPFGARAGVRVLLAGSAAPDEGLHLAVEAAGANVIAESGDHALGYPLSLIESDAEPLDALARHYHALSAGPRAFCQPGTELLSRVRAVRADAVIFWLLEQEEARGWDLPAQQRALQGAGVPFLTLTRRTVHADEATREAIGQFIREGRPT